MKYVFVCGMPRSGTTMVAREIARFAGCTGFENTGVMMDEGQYLQDVYPTEWACGGAGRFGFDPRSHLTEESCLLTPASVDRLRRQWERFWDKNKAIRVEKSPGNLLKTRFLQAALPDAYFVVIKRHPVAVSLATQKWSRTPLHELLSHWLRCHEIFDKDKKRLERLHELSYEDYIEDPKRHLQEIAYFIGTEFSGSLEEQATDGYNKKYLDRWSQMLQRSPFRAYYHRVADEYEPRFVEHDYSLQMQTSGALSSLSKQKAARRRSTSLLHVAANISAFLSRANLLLRVRARRALDERCAQSVRAFFGAHGRYD